MELNKYKKTLSKIIERGKYQKNNKGNIKYLINEKILLKPRDLLEIFEGRVMPRNKLKTELGLFMKGERLTSTYKEKGIDWWEYCGPILINSYPTYFERLPRLIEKINKEGRSSKNYVLFLGDTLAETSQQPCLSLIQFQIDNGKLIISAYQRSSDASLGLPSDIYHLYLISRELNFRLKSITLFLGNVHIYENNLKLTKSLLKGENVKFKLNV